MLFLSLMKRLFHTTPFPESRASSATSSMTSMRKPLTFVPGFSLYSPGVVNGSCSNVFDMSVKSENDGVCIAFLGGDEAGSGWLTPVPSGKDLNPISISEPSRTSSYFPSSKPSLGISQIRVQSIVRSKL